MSKRRKPIGLHQQKDQSIVLPQKFTISNALELVPGSGAFTTVSYSSTFTYFQYGVNAIDFYFNFETSSLTKGSASGDVKIALTSNFNSAFNFGQSPVFQVSQIHFSSSEGIPSSVSRAEFRAQYNGNSYIQLYKVDPIGSCDREDWTELQVSDLLDHTSGYKNSINASFSLIWLY